MAILVCCIFGPYPGQTFCTRVYKQQESSKIFLSDLWDKCASVSKYFTLIATHLFTNCNLYNSSQYEFYCVLNDKRLCCENKPENSCLSASWKQQFSALCLVPQQKTLHLKVSTLIRLYQQNCFGIICPRFWLLRAQNCLVFVR